MGDWKDTDKDADMEDTLESRRVFGYSVHTARAIPGNTAFKELMGNEAYTEPVLSF